MPHRETHIILLCALTVLTAGCTGSGGGNNSASRERDTVYTERAAMAVYDYDPVRALQIVDSAVVVGNMTEVRADLNRAKIYSYSQQAERLDSLLSVRAVGGASEERLRAGIRLDSARVIGERVLASDSARSNARWRQDVLAILAYVARLQADTTRWMQRSEQLIATSRETGDETEALRTEAELAAARFYMGQEQRALAKLDSVIAELSAPSLTGKAGGGSFATLDAFIIASKRKIGLLSIRERYAETLPLSFRILERLDDYEAHPDRYHDGSSREPQDSTDREDYIRFYRSQAQNFIIAAQAALENGADLKETFLKMEHAARDAAAREHLTRYRVLEQQLATERQQARANSIRQQAVGIFIILLLTVVALVWSVWQRRIVSRKNRVLVGQIADAIRYKKMYEQLQAAQAQPSPQPDTAGTPADDDLDALSHDELFEHIQSVIMRERLYLNPSFDRRALIAHLHLSPKQVGKAFAQGSDFANITRFINECRLEHACELLVSTDRSIDDVAAASGYSVRHTFSRLFKEKYSLTPSEYRRQQTTEKG